MSPLHDPGFSGRHLREVMRLRSDACEAGHYQGNHPNVPTQLAAHARRI